MSHKSPEPCSKSPAGVIRSQLWYALHADLGFKTDAIVTLGYPRDNRPGKTPHFRSEEKGRKYRCLLVIVTELSHIVSTSLSMNIKGPFLILLLLSLFVSPTRAQKHAPPGNQPTYSEYTIPLPRPDYDSSLITYNYYSIDQSLRGKRYQTFPLTSQPWPSQVKLDSLCKKSIQTAKKIGDKLFAFGLDDCFSIQDLFELATVFQNNRLAFWKYDPRNRKVYAFTGDDADTRPPVLNEVKGR